jgi:hypothetical protein
VSVSLASRILTHERRQLLKRYPAGRLASALNRRFRTPIHATLSLAAHLADGRPRPLGSPRLSSSSVPAVACFIAGPGSRRWLEDSIESVSASDPQVAVVVVDDGSLDCRAAVLRRRFPALDVLRVAWPTGGPPLGWRPTVMGIRHALEHYEFPLFFKLDTDAIVTGVDFATKIAERLRDDPDAGMAGSVGLRADGAVEDRFHHAAVITREAARDARLAAALERVTEGTWRLGDTVQGGGFCLTGEACRRLQTSGCLDWRQSWVSLISEDAALSLFVRTLGLNLVALGGPDGVFAIAIRNLPLELEELATGDWLVAHSTHRGKSGETEEHVRDFFRVSRGRADAGPAR